MKTTTFHLPTAAGALLHETIMATVLHDWMVPVMCLKAPHTAHGPEEGETDVEYASRAWAWLLPNQGGILLQLRMQYGWQAQEITQIVHMLGIAMGRYQTAALAEKWGSPEQVALSQQKARLHNLIRQWHDSSRVETL